MYDKAKRKTTAMENNNNNIHPFLTDKESEFKSRGSWPGQNPILSKQAEMRGKALINIFFFFELPFGFDIIFAFYYSSSDNEKFHPNIYSVLLFGILERFSRSFQLG